MNEDLTRLHFVQSAVKSAFQSAVQSRLHRSVASRRYISLRSLVARLVASLLVKYTILIYLSRDSVVVGELGKRLGQRTLLGEELDKSSVLLDLAVLSSGHVLLSVEVGETPLLGDDDLLLAGELVSASSQTLDHGGLVVVLGSDGNQNLANVDTGGKTSGLTPSTSHTLGKSIGSGARKHLVDSQHVEGVGSDSHVEGVSAGNLGDVLVGTDSGGLQSLGRQLLSLVGDQMDTQREVVDVSSLSAQIVDSDLGVGHGSVVSRLGEGLVLLVSVTLSGSSSHFWVSFLGPWLSKRRREEGLCTRMQCKEMQPNARRFWRHEVALCKDDELTNAFFRVAKEIEQGEKKRRARKTRHSKDTDSANQTVVSPRMTASASLSPHFALSTF